MKRKLSHIISPWRRRSITVYMKSLLFLGKFASPRARIHWVGNYRRRPRLERPVIILLFLSAMIVLEAREYAIWSAIWGGFTSIFIIVYAIYRLIPRKRNMTG